MKTTILRKGFEERLGYIKKAFKNQIEKRGFSMVEILSMCPTYTGRSVKASTDWIKEHTSKYYPLGVIKDV